MTTTDNPPAVSEAEWRALRDMARTEYPLTAKAGRYLFFALCGLGLSILAYVAVRSVGWNKGVASSAANAAWLASFLALREMSKAWDLARRAVSSARKGDA